MAKKLRLPVTVAALGCLSLSAAFACGEKLVALGGGLPFGRMHVAEHPGKVILYLNPGSRLQTANEDMRLARALTLAGHKVSTVATRAELDRARQETGADLVLMGWADALQLNARLTDALPTLPVIYGANVDELAAAQSQQRCVVETSKRGSYQLVRTIERIVEDHQKGLPADCAKIGGQGVV